MVRSLLIISGCALTSGTTSAFGQWQRRKPRNALFRISGLVVRAFRMHSRSAKHSTAMFVGVNR